MNSTQALKRAATMIAEAKIEGTVAPHPVDLNTRGGFYHADFSRGSAARAR